jgi:hypothetical protein
MAVRIVVVVGWKYPCGGSYPISSTNFPSNTNSDAPPSSLRPFVVVTSFSSSRNRQVVSSVSVVVVVVVFDVRGGGG